MSTIIAEFHLYVCPSRRRASIFGDSANLLYSSIEP